MKISIGSVVAGALLLASAVSAAEVKVETRAAAPVGSGVAYFVSPRGAHIASISMDGSRTVVALDGVAGPKLDQVLGTSGGPIGGIHGLNPSPAGFVAFSRDGDHFAYVGQQGNETVVFLDGKELQRLPFVSGMFRNCPVQFSPAGKHLFYVVDSARPNAHPRFVLDGAFSPFLPTDLPPSSTNGIVFSPDESRFAFVGTNPDKPGASVFVVDGKDPGYLAEEPQFSADGKHVLGLACLPEEQRLLVDGHPSVRAHIIHKVCVPPAGDRIVSILSRAGQDGSPTSFLVVDGKRVEDSLCQTIPDVVFSPDGKRYAACCQGRPGEQQWVVVDGKKGASYTSIPNPEEIRFSPDSTKVAYRAMNNGKHFIVVDGEESQGWSQVRFPPYFSPVGARVAYVAGPDGAALRAVIDGKPLAPRTAVEKVTFSADAAHYAFLFGTMGVGGSPRSLAVDGVDQEGFAVFHFQFSPDGTHVESVANRAKDGLTGLFVDKDLVYVPGERVSRETFTPDGRHLFWFAAEQPAPDAEAQPVLYLDGKPLARFDVVHEANFQYVAEAWDMGADGVLTVLGPKGDSIQRLRITPGDDTNLATMVAGAAAEAAAKAPKRGKQ